MSNKTDWFPLNMKFDSTCIQCGNGLDAGTRHMARKNGTKGNGKPCWEFMCNSCHRKADSTPGAPAEPKSNPLDTLEQARQHLKAEVGEEITTEEENHLFGAPEKFSERWFEQNAVWGRI